MGRSSSSTIAVAMYLAFYVLLTALFFLWLATILYRCYRRSHAISAEAASVGPAILLFDGTPGGGLGLEAAVIDTFPKFRFSTTSSSSSWECSVCLGVFEENEIVRMLPKCGHVFHAECVDTWLRLHATCPFCRANLLPPPPPDRTGGDVTEGD